MVATCYTLRPSVESGWVTFFELGRGAAFPGFFLILGPATAAGSRPDPEARHEAQTVARAIVAAWKNRSGADLSEWLKALPRLVGLAARPIEFGAVILRGEEIHFLCEGRVRVFPLTTSARHRWETDLPVTGQISRRRVEIGDRFFFGRLADEQLRGLPAPDALEHVERAGGQDGALILTFLPGSTPDDAAAAQRQSTNERLAAPAAAPEPALASPPTGSSIPPTGPTMAPPPARLQTARRLTPAAPLAEPPAEATAVRPPAPHRAGSPQLSLVPDIPPQTAPAAAAVVETREAADAPFDDDPPAPARWPWWALGAGVLALVLYFAVLRPRVMPPDGSSDVAATDPAAPEPAGNAGAPAPPTPIGVAPGVAWEAVLGGAITGTPLVLPDRVIVAGRDGRIGALDRRDGRTIWSQNAGKGFGGGAVRADTLVALGGFDGILRLLQPGDGREMARLVTDSRIASPPAVTTDGFIVTGAYDHTLYALDPASGRAAWSVRLGGILWATPGIGRRYVYAPGLDGVLTAVNSRWGSVLWRFKAGGEIYSAPAATDDAVVFGCEDGSVYAIRAEEGTLLWRTPVGKPVSGGVRIHDRVVLVGDDGGILHALDLASGREAWRYAAGAAIKSIPVVDSGAVLVSSHDGALHAVDISSGARIGRYPIGSPIAAAPALSGDSLFVGTHDGRVVALRLR